MFTSDVHSTVERYPTAAGLPKHGRYVAISNSDMSRLPCERRFLFSQVQHLVAKATGAMELGSAWDTIAEDVFRWWALCDSGYPDEGLDRCPFCRGSGMGSGMVGLKGLWDGRECSANPCGACGGTGKSALARAMQAYRVKVEAGDISQDDFDMTEETLRRMLQGYLAKWHSGPLDTIRIVDTKVRLARVIVNPATGKPFKPEILLERGQDGSWEMAGVDAVGRASRGEGEFLRVRWPWYQVGELDVLACDRVTKKAWVLDVKGSGQPSRYQRGMLVDPQLPGYCWLLEPHLKHYMLTGIAGFMYDVANTKFQPDPKVLKWAPPTMEELRAMADGRGIKVTGRKSEDYCKALGIEPGHGGFSVAQNSGVPSWRFEWALEAAGVDRAPYEEHIQTLMATVDPGLYDRPWQPFGDATRQRYGREVFAKAVKMHELRKAATLSASEEDLDIRFPRTAVCTAPGSGCPYTDLCAQDGDSPRECYNVTPTQRWAEEPVRQSAETDKQPTINW